MAFGVHINRPSSTRYQARVRYRGHQKYKLIGPRTRDCRRAIMALALAMATRNYKRGDVLTFADYYDPQVVCELVRR